MWSFCQGVHVRPSVHVSVLNLNVLHLWSLRSDRMDRIFHSLYRELFKPSPASSELLLNISPYEMKSCSPGLCAVECVFCVFHTKPCRSLPDLGHWWKDVLLRFIVIDSTAAVCCVLSGAGGRSEIVSRDHGAVLKKKKNPIRSCASLCLWRCSIFSNLRLHIQLMHGHGFWAGVNIRLVCVYSTPVSDEYSDRTCSGGLYFIRKALGLAHVAKPFALSSFWFGGSLSCLITLWLSNWCF